jgi:hypothetical protein
MAIRGLVALGNLDRELSDGKFIDELSDDVTKYLSMKEILDFIHKYEKRYPHLENGYFKNDPLKSHEPITFWKCTFPRN